MKIIYFGEIHSTDSDFPLVKALQKAGIDVIYFVPLIDRFKRAGIIDIKKLPNKPGIYKASDFDELRIFKSYINLDKIFFIYYKEGRTHLSTWITIFKTFILFRKLKADILHSVWPLSWLWKILYYLNIPILQVVHDPIRHSNVKSKRDEDDRIIAFKKSAKLVLLNKAQLYEFMTLYNIPEEKIILSHMGYFDYFQGLDIKINHKNKYGNFILFFGQIFSYKGLEYLCEAMTKVHLKHPEINLVIAGKGNLYFNFSPYENLPYIKLLNEYIPLDKLVELLHDCLFSVCPYIDATQSGVVQTSFSAETPVIVTNVGALPETVTNRKTGLIIPPKDLDALICAINELIESPYLLDEMRDNIREWRSKMNWNSIAQDYIKCYISILNQ